MRYLTKKILLILHLIVIACIYGFADDCTTLYTDSLVIWGDDYVANSNTQCWIIDLQDNKAVKITYQISFYPYSPASEMYIMSMDNDGNIGTIGLNYLKHFTGGNYNGTVISPTTSGKVYIHYKAGNGGNSTWKGFKLYFETIENPITDSISIVNNKLGIRTTNPLEALHIEGSIRGPEETNGALTIKSMFGKMTIGSRVSQYANFQTDRNSYLFDKPIFLIDATLSSTNSANFSIKTNNSTRLFIKGTNGYLGLGTTSPAYKLDVNGTIRSTSGIITSAINTSGLISASSLNVTNSITTANLNVTTKITTTNLVAKDILVTNPSTADFVFDNNYKLKTLSDLKDYIEEHQHLPDIQSAEEMQENGVKINELQIQLLQKIEELTLYILQQEQKIEKLEKQIELLK